MRGQSSTQVPATFCAMTHGILRAMESQMSDPHAGRPRRFDPNSGQAVRRAFLLALLASASALEAAPPPPPETLAHIEADGLRARIRFLADDALEGRGTGTRGYEVASAWVATQMEAVGLEPAGEKGGWFQPVPLVRTRVAPEARATAVSRKGEARDLGDQALVFAGPLTTEIAADAELVFAGYGISAPNRGRDDYRGLDVRGRVVAVLGGAPVDFPADERAHHGSPTVKDEVAAAHGAVGIVHLLDMTTSAPFWRMLKRVQQGTLRWVPPTAVGAGAKTLPFTVALSDQGSAMLLADSGKSLAQLKRARPGQRIQGRLKVQGAVHRETVTTRNVAGLLRGRGPLAAETVVFTAHLDHLGTAAGEGDQIRNGAMDNASGVAALLEAAEAFVSAPAADRRSVMFLAVAAEEAGLLGSSYFAAHPMVRAESIVANVNLDMLPLLRELLPLRDVLAFGSEHSSLHEVVKSAAAAEGLRVVPDPIPEQRVFVRSDQYSFVKKGVPAVMLFGGGGPDPAVPWLPVFMKWMETTYHGPEDELTPATDLGGAVTLARVSFRIGWEVAHEPRRPRWNPGDFFGETFGRGR
jgi:hypothetical protein